jgi:hypothetical protein
VRSGAKTGLITLFYVAESFYWARYLLSFLIGKAH